jgi:histidinol-phosphate phosphatase family protein
MRQAVIMAGGKGTRLAERLNGRPKPLVDIDGVPLLQRQIDALRRGRFTELVLLVNHAADQIEAFIAKATPDGMTIRLIDDGSPRGTAGALIHAVEHLDERFLVVYGDTLFDVDLEHFWQSHAVSGADASLFLHPNDHPFDSDLVEIDATSRVIALHGTPHDPQAWLPNLVNAGMYVLEREAIAFWSDAPPPSDIARDLFPAMLRRGGHLHGYVSFEYIKDIGTPKRLDKAVGHLRSGLVERARRDTQQQAVFLDRDGTINVLRGHLSRAEDMELLPSAAHAVRRLNDAEYRVVVVTNQPVLARGETSEAELRRIHGKMEALLGRDGAFIDWLYYCPHHPDTGFAGEVVALKRICDCRKPAPGLIDRARTELNIDLARSWLIGDSTADLALAQARGVTSVLVRTGAAGRDLVHAVVADFVADDLADAISLILDRYPALAKTAQPLAARCKAGSMVLIGGLARSGKSSLAGALARTLRDNGLAARVISLDHWLYSAADRLPGVLGRYNMAAAEQAVVSLQAGMTVRVPMYDPLTCTSHPDYYDFGLTPGEILIVEGCPALLSEQLRELATVTAYVSCPTAIRHARFVSEYERRGLVPAEIDSLYDSRETDEHAVIRSFAHHADHVINLSDILAP